jgi:uroporphyrinogen-III decarboxylase
MPSLSPKENYLRTLRHEENEYVPIGWIGPGLDTDAAMVGLFSPTDSGQEFTGFVDGYGVRWDVSESAVGGKIPAPGEFILKDVTRWKKDIIIPDVEKYDWQKLVEQEYSLFNVDRDKQALCFVANAGVWERLADLMGFEEAMIALIEEPEACNELLTAITDHKIRLAEKAAKYYKADVFINFDDIATERNLFMSPDTFRNLIKPHWQRLHNAVKNLGMIPIQHICGHAETCIEDYIETGAEGWNATQPTNDIVGILDKYGDRFCIEGGWNTNGKPSQPSASIEEVKVEVERCFNKYGSKKGYIFWPLILASTDMKDIDAKYAAILETANKLRFAGK